MAAPYPWLHPVVSAVLPGGNYLDPSSQVARDSRKQLAEQRLSNGGKKDRSIFGRDYFAALA